jgi:formylglycine-generating enzyme required for sulfatase activity
LHAYESGGLTQKQPEHKTADSAQEENMESMHLQMHAKAQSDAPIEKISQLQLLPVINSKPNAYGIRGLNGSIREWGLLISQLSSRDKLREAEYVVLPSTIQRQPWEGFAEVGFRCVREVDLERKK